MPVLQPSTTQTRERPVCKSYSDAYLFFIFRRGKAYLLVLYALVLCLSFLSKAQIIPQQGFIEASTPWKLLFFGSTLWFLLAILSCARLLTSGVNRRRGPSLAAEIISTLTFRDNWILTSMYLCSSLVTFQLFLGFLHNEVYTRSILVYPKGEESGARQLNQEYLFIAFYAMTLGLSVGIKKAFQKTPFLNATTIQQPKFFSIKTSIAPCIFDASKWALQIFGLAYILFLFCHGLLYERIVPLYGLYTSVLNAPVVGFRWWDVYLFLRMLQVGFLQAITWNLADRLYDIYFLSTGAVSEQYANGFECLLSGLHSKNMPRVRSYAFAELALLAIKNPSRRKDLYLDVEHQTWSRISKECISAVSELRTSLRNEFQDRRTLESPVPTTKPVENPTIDRINVVGGNVLAPRKLTGPYYDDRTGNLLCMASAFIADSIPVPTLSKESIRKQTEQVTNSRFAKFLRGVALRGNAGQWLKNACLETRSRKIESVFSNSAITIWAIQALGSLTAKSAQEDTLGYIRDDVNTVLDSLLGCLADIERFLRTPPRQYLRLEDDTESTSVQAPCALVMALREAVYQIRIAYRGYEETFSVQVEYTEKWQRFLAYTE